MRAWFPFVFAISLAACSSSSGGSGFEPDGGGAGGDNGGGDDSGVVGCAACTIDGSLGPPSDAAPATGPTVLYAHDKDTLYQVDPTDPTLAVTALGKFDCIGTGKAATSMTDIAIDADKNLFGVGTTTLFLDMTLKTGGVACPNSVPIQGGTIAAKAKFFGESFAPKGTLDPSAETLLVGNNQGEIYAVDTASGALIIVGTFGAVPADDGNGNTYPSDPSGGASGTTFQMSGDIVFLANGGAPVGFATVRDCKTATTCSQVDTLIELDVSKLAKNNTGSVRKSVRGQVKKAAGCGDTKNAAYGGMYGIAAFEDKVIGFSSQGFIVSIRNTDGTACLIHDYSGTIKFDGAGVTTSAPVTAPPPK